MLNPRKVPDVDLDTLVAAHIRTGLGDDKPTESELRGATAAPTWKAFVKSVRGTWGHLFHASSKGPVSHEAILGALLDLGLGPLSMSASVPAFEALLESKEWRSGEWARKFTEFVLGLPAWEGTYHDVLEIANQFLVQEAATWDETLVRVFKLFTLLFLYASIKGGASTRWPLPRGEFARDLIRLAQGLQRFSQTRVRLLIFETHDIPLEDRDALIVTRARLTARWNELRNTSTKRMRDIGLGRLLTYVSMLYSVVIGPYVFSSPWRLEDTISGSNALSTVPIPQGVEEDPQDLGPYSDSDE